MLLYIDLHNENCSGFILLNMGFHKFIHRYAKHALGFGNSNIRFKITRKKIMLLLRNEK
jgi:hypothetical protein